MKPPRPGKLYINQEYGTSINTIFQIEAQDFKDAHLPLQYQYQIVLKDLSLDLEYQDEILNDNFTLSTFSTEKSFKTVLPRGAKQAFSDETYISIILTVKNSLGATT